MSEKQLLGIISVLLTVVSTLPYIWSMLKGSVRPHIFSWTIWCLNGAIISHAQLVAGAGPGAWAARGSMALSLLIVLLSLRQTADWHISRGDWVAFVISLSIIPIWYLTDNPLWAAVLVTFVDSMAFYPTMHKSYEEPYTETIFLYFASLLKHIASVFAMEQYSLTALIMPVAMLGMNSGVILLLVWRRHALRPMLKTS